MQIVTLLFMLIIWLPFGHTSLAAIYVFVALFGFGTGSWMAMTPATLATLSGKYTVLCPMLALPRYLRDTG